MAEQNPHKEHKGLSPRQTALIFVIIALWIMVFLGGILVNSEPYREIVSSYSLTASKAPAVNPDSESDTINVFTAWLVVVFFYTPTNILLLAMVSGVLGALSRMARLHTQEEDELELPSDKTNPLISGMLRGVFVYLLLISGMLIINEEPFIKPTQVQYLRLAGFLSLLSFLLSYNPSRFRSFLSKGLEKFENKIDPR